MSGSQQFGNGGSEASDDAVFLGSDDATCLGHRGDDGLGIEGLDGERIYDFRGNALSLELDGGLKGIVMDITMRHVVLRTIDTVDVIIPNSKINSSTITNMSHNTKIRSVHMRFNVAYGTDMDKAMKVLRDAVIESEYSEPEWKNKDYGPVYFIAYADSSLVLATTVYYKPTNATEMVMSDINKRVNDAFAREGIEIPYNYVNVVMKKDD